jgi:cytolysin-activating lysine-acyltransferase
MIRSPEHKNLRINDLQTRVVPPLFSGQFAILDVERADSPNPLPIAVAFWANVSNAVDQRLSRDVSPFAELQPDEWTSGDITWLIDVIGDDKAKRVLVLQLINSGLLNGSTKMRNISADGKLLIEALC